MNRIKIFLASSINEFKDERNEIGDLIRKIQDILIDYDVRIKLFECEFADNNISLGRKQQEYNEQIKDSNIFLMLVGKTIGQYTLEEFNIAKQNNIKEIIVIFSNAEHDEKVKELKQEIKNVENVKEYEITSIKELNDIIKTIIKKFLNDEGGTKYGI